MKHHLLTLLLAFAAYLSAAAQDNTADFFGIRYQILDDDARTCKVIYADTYSQLAATKPLISVAPSVDINGKTYTVTAIDDEAFCCTAFTSISLPTGITTIGDFAFEGCENLTSINIPTTVTSVGEEAFSGAPCFGPKVQISVNLREIGIAAFSCPGLTEYSVAVGNPNFCSIDGVLFTKDRKTLVDYPWGRNTGSGSAYSVPAGTTTIAPQAFCGHHLTSLTLPEGLTTISEFAFWGSTIDGPLTFPASLTTIHDDAFMECHGVTAFDIDPVNTSFVSRDGVLFSKDMTTLRLYPIGHPSNTYIVPDGITTIGVNAFRAAQNLKHLYLPEGLTTIAPDAVYGCYNLADIVIPASVTTIGGYAFAFCIHLANIYCRSTVPAQAGEGAFNSTAKGCILHIPTGTRAAYINKGWKGNYISNYNEEAQVTPPCAKPVIELVNGQLRITSATPGAYCTVRAYMPSFSGSSSKELGLDNATSFTAKPTLKVQAWATTSDGTYSGSPISERTFQLGSNDIDANNVLDINDINAILDGVLQK